MTDFAQAFKNDHNNISDAVQQDWFKRLAWFKFEIV